MIALLVTVQKNMDGLFAYLVGSLCEYSVSYLYLLVGPIVRRVDGSSCRFNFGPGVIRC